MVQLILIRSLAGQARLGNFNRLRGCASSLPDRPYNLLIDQINEKNSVSRLKSTIQPIRCIHSTLFCQKQEVTDREFSQPQQHQELQPQQDWQSSLSVPPHVDPKLSYAYGRSFKELKHCTFGPLIDSMSLREPHSTAAVIYDEGISKNFDELNQDVNRLVNGMVNKLGLQRGDSVGIFSYNCYQFLLVQFACHKLGLVFVPINPSYKSHEFNYVLTKSNLNVLFMPGKNSRQSQLNDHWSIICDKSLADLQAQQQNPLEELKTIIILDGDHDQQDLLLQGIKCERWLTAFTRHQEIDQHVQSKLDQVRSDDLYGIYYTSGTTGFPKGAAITQFNVINNVHLSFERMFNQRGPKFENIRPRICLPLPLFHEFAGVLGVLSPFMGDGGSFVFPGMRYSVQSVVESIMRFKCNAIFLTPTILIDILGYIESNTITNVPLKTMLVAGSPVMSELVHKTRKILPDLEELRIGYGSSENGVIATIQTTYEPEETRPYTVGPPLDFTEIRIADTNTGSTTLLGDSGEVQTRGFNTMLCYHNDQERTNEVLTKARWYKTGDLGIIDKKGSLQIVGRIKDIIIKGGENIYPAEVETVLHKMQVIEDAHVFGVPDKRFGEEVCVWVKLSKTSAGSRSEDEIRKEIIDYCKVKLTYFKVPRYVIFVEQFPVTPVKKIKKFEMRAQTAKMLNLP